MGTANDVNRSGLPDHLPPLTGLASIAKPKLDLRVILRKSACGAMLTGKGRATCHLPGELEAHYEELHRFALSKTRSAALADDVMQDAWLKLFDLVRAPGFDDRSVRNPMTYLRRLIANMVIDKQRQTAAQARRVTSGELPLDAQSEGPSAFQVLAARQEMAVVQAAVAELPDKCRAVFLLYRGQGLTMQQVADRLDISPRTVENHLAKAMSHCRRRLKEARGDE